MVNTTLPTFIAITMLAACTLLTQCRMVAAWTGRGRPLIVTGTRRHQVLRRHFLQPAVKPPPPTSDQEAAYQQEAAPVVKVPAKFVPYPFQYHDVLTLKIEALTNRGLGIGRMPVNSDHDDDDRNKNDSNEQEQPRRPWVIMVPNVIPGELVKVRVFRNFNNYSEADLVEILEPSKDRVEPRCALASECGGCQYQHMSISSQRHWKTLHVIEALRQFGLDDDVEVAPCLGTDEIYGYRSKLTPHFQAPAKRKRGASKPEPASIDAIGFQRQTSRQIVDVPSCPIATDAVNREYQQKREELLSQPTLRKRGATLLFRQANLDDDTVTTNHKDQITTTIRGLGFSYLAGNFFQNNYYVLPLMVDHIVQQATRCGDMTHLVDCYCGSGLFAISAAAHFDTVIGIETNDKAVAEATANAQANGIDNCKFLAANAEQIFETIQDFPRNTTIIVLDPPRKGCSDDFLQQLCQFAPGRIVYMSCDPTTQARDAATIVQAGGYSITSVQPFDLFPQTRHIECLAVFEKQK